MQFGAGGTLLPSASKTGNHEADAHAGRQGNVKQTYCRHSRPPWPPSHQIHTSTLFLKRGGANTPLNQKHGRGATMFESVANLLHVAALIFSAVQASADILVVTLAEQWNFSGLFFGQANRCLLGNHVYPLWVSETWQNRCGVDIR